MATPRLPYSAALEVWDRDAILNSLAEDVVIYVAVHDDPLPGKAVAQFLFGVLADELGDLTISDEILEADRAAITFETSIGDTRTQGLNVARFNEAGAINELTVFFRPLAALDQIARIVGAHMETQFGPPPD